MSSALVSDPTDGRVLLSLSYPLGGAVDAEESDERWGAVLKGGTSGWALVVIWLDDGPDDRILGTAAVMDGERGSSVCFSRIEDTIFSRLKGAALLFAGSDAEGGSKDASEALEDRRVLMEEEGGVVGRELRRDWSDLRVGDEDEEVCVLGGVDGRDGAAGHRVC